MNKNYSNLLPTKVGIDDLRECSGSLYKRRSKSMIGFVLLFLLSLFGSIDGNAQTILINPAGDGGFENGATFAENGWTALNASTDGWSTGNVPTPTGVRCAYVSTNSGETWTYSQTSTILHLYKDFTVPAGESKVTLSFKWKAKGEGSTYDWDNMKVFVIPASSTPVQGIAISNDFKVSGPGANDGMYKLSHENWNSESISFARVPGTTYRLVFSWKSDGSTIANPPAAIDNVSLVSATPGNYVTIASGNWGDATIWDSGMVPTSLDNATITAGHAVTINATGQNVNNLTVNGTLGYTTTPTSFAVNGNLTVGNGGFVNIFSGTTGKTLTVAGNIVNNGTIDVSVGSTTAGTLTLNGTSVQTVSGSGAFNNNVIRNLIFTNSSTDTPNIIWSVDNIKIAYNLNVTGARIALGNNKMTFGNNAAGNTLTAPNGSGFLSGSKFARWWTAGATGSAVPYGTTGATTDITTTTSKYPFVANNGMNRSVWITRSSSNDPNNENTAGELEVVYTDANTTTRDLNIADGAYNINERFNGNWAITASPEYEYVTGTHAVALSAQNAIVTSTFNTRVMNANSVVGTHKNSNTTPTGFRSEMTLAQLTASPFYLGIASDDVPYVSIANGNWSDASTWNKGIAPSCNDVVTIAVGTNVTVNSASAVAKNITIASGGTLTMTSGDLTVGCTLNNNSFINNGTLTVTGGTLNINGNLMNNAGSTFNQSGGDIVVDGNDGVVANSVATGTVLIQVTASAVGNLNLTGGKITIVNPHRGSATTDYALRISQAGAANSATSAHTVQFGDGNSTVAGGSNTNGFYFYLSQGGFVYALGNIIVDTQEGTNRFVKSTGNVGLRGGLNIISGEYQLATTTIVGGNIVNNGILTSTSLLALGDYVAPSSISPSENAPSISGTGIFRNLATNPTASLTNFQVNNTNATGVTLNVPLSVSGTLTINSGIINTAETSVLHLGTDIAAGTLTVATPSATTMIKGPFSRTILNGNSSYIPFPVGSTAYSPIALNPATTAVSKFKVTAFDSNTGTANAAITNLSSNRRWEASKVSGDFTTIKVGLGDALITSTNIPVQAATANGEYTSAFGSVATFTEGTPNTIQSNEAIASADYTGFISFADSNACSGTPTPGNTIASATTICFGQTVSLSLENTVIGTGVTYQWKSSTDGVTYTNIEDATATTLNVVPSTATYYKCEVTCATGPAMGASVSAFINFNNTILSTTPAARCGTGTVTLSATSNQGSSIKWFANDTSSEVIGTGASFVTPIINESTIYYASSVSPGTGVVNVGSGTTTTSQTGVSPFSVTYETARTQYIIRADELTSMGLMPGNITALSFDVTSTNTWALKDYTIKVGSTSSNVISGAFITPTTAFTTVFGPIDYTVSTAGIKKLNFATPYNWDGTSNLVVEICFSNDSDGTCGNCYGSTISTRYTATTYDSVYAIYSDNVTNCGSATGTNSLSTTYRKYRPNMIFDGVVGCYSPRVPVTATVTTPPAFTLSEEEVVICEGQSSTSVTIETGASDYSTFVWEPSEGVTGNAATGWVFNPTTSTTYTLNATQSGENTCATQVSLSVVVNPLPSTITFAENSVETCIDIAKPLEATGGIVELLNEDFNAPTNNWTTVNNSTGTNAANTAWTLRSDSYTPNSGYILRSNDQSQFYISNSDAGGSGSNTNTFLISPTFSTSGLSKATLSYWHYFRGTGTCKVQFSTDNGTTWIDLKTYTAAVGQPAAFVNEIIELPVEAVNKENVKIRFHYSANWQYYWAIDNVKVTTNAIKWSPITNLYTDAAATTPYEEGVYASTVYFKSNTVGTNNYTASATSSSNCTVSNTVTVIVSEIPTVVTVNQNALCNSGTVDLTAAGVTTGSTAGLTFTYFTNAEGTTAVSNPTAVGIGTYYIKGTTASGCSAISSVVVTQPEVLLATVTNPVHVACNGGTTGSSVVTVVGGTSPYTYLWSNGSQTAELSNVAAGTYTVEVTDANGCTASSSVTITEPELLTASITNPTNVTCNGGNDGAATVIVNGGVAPYTYLWNNDAITDSISLIAAGNYNVVITDANGCTANAEVIITEPVAIVAEILNPTHISCNGGNNGAATVTITNGVAPYTYLWNNNEATAGITNLAPGTYSVVVTDANGCTANASVTINDGTSINLVITNPSASCNGTVDITVPAVVAGSDAGLTYTYWADPFGEVTFPSPNAISSSGTFYIKATNVAGCSVIMPVNVTVNNTVAPTGTAVQDFTAGQTLADFTLVGQNIIWYSSETGTTVLPSTTVLVSGTIYYASQTVNGCESSTRLAITAGTDLKSPEFNLNQLRVYPNPVQDILTIDYSETIQGVQVFNMLGQIVYNRNTNASQVKIDMSAMATGTYIVQMTVNGITKNVKVIKK